MPGHSTVIARARTGAWLLGATLMVGCQIFYNPLLNIPINASGTTRSPPFRIHQDSQHWIMIGMDPMAVDAATCAAAAMPPPAMKAPPCNELTPPMGAIAWTVTRAGKTVAHGRLDAAAPAVPGGRPNSWSEDKRMAWATYPGWFATAGNDYAIEITVASAALDWAQYHPRLAIVQPL